MNVLDEHCLDIIARFKKGELTKEEAELRMRAHGDRITVQLYENGFAVRFNKPQTI